MNQERKERIKERAYGLAMGASIPGVIVVPGLIYYAAKGDIEALKGLGQLGGVVMGGWGLAGMGDGDLSMRDGLRARRDRKAIKVSSRLSLKERFRDLPQAPDLVETFLRQMYEEWELDSLQKYDPKSNASSVDGEKVFMEVCEPVVVSAHLAAQVTNKLVGLINKGHDSLYRLSGEDKQRQITETDSIIALLQFGWKVKDWHDKGGSVELDEVQPYSEVAIAGSVTNWVSRALCINSKKKLRDMLNVLAVPSYLRE